MYTVYGLLNCDSTQKAIKWLAQHQLPHALHNYKLAGITVAQLNDWANQVDWTLLLNKQSTTYRSFDDSTKQAITQKEAAIATMAANSSVIKRPIVTRNNQIIAIGFKEATYQELFKIN